MVSMRSLIFAPDIEPLTSKTQTKSTLLLFPPDDFKDTIAGMTSNLEPVVIVDLKAFILSSIFPGFYEDVSLVD